MAKAASGERLFDGKWMFHLIQRKKLLDVPSLPNSLSV